MSDREIILVRHGETAWSKLGKHTGRTDVPLTDAGRETARSLAPKLGARSFRRVLSSPLSRARDTCALAGFGARAELNDGLLEWDYGDYEGLLSVEIREMSPGWTVFSRGCPNGESPADVARRVDALIADLERGDGDVLVFAHGHILRAFAARWIEASLEIGARLMLETAHASTLGFERGARVIRSWNAEL